MGDRHRKPPKTLLDAYNAGVGDGMIAAVAIMNGWTGKALDDVIKHDIEATRRALSTDSREDGQVPISAEKMNRYPGGSIHSKEWKAFRAEILKHADNKCEGTPQYPECRAENRKPHPETGGHVVLTIAHMDHDETHADPDRCRALCQRCHNAWDAPHRRSNAAKTRRAKSPQADLVDLLDADP